MSSRRPAEPSFTSRPTGAFARSPAERLEPTRPARRARWQRYPREPRASRPLVRFLSGVFTLLLLLMGLTGGAAILLQSRIEAPGPLARSKAVVIPKGEGAHEIAARLERDGVVSDRRLFVAAYLLSKIAGGASGAKSVQLKAGDYQIPQGASVRQVIDIISDGRTITYRVSIPEGLTSHQIVERLKTDQNLTGEIAEVPPEGTLLPETFVLQRGASRQTIIDNMQAEARKLMDKAWAQRKKDLPLKSWQEAVVLASIVEKETGRNDERERVAAVFINRLSKNMRLQSDPTIIYGMMGGKVVWNRPILRSEIMQKTAHNTYQIDGLPPTPICNPGKASIEAVLNPAQTKDLYFVADGTGGHMFADTLKEHNANVLKWRALEKDMKAKASPAPGDTPTTAAPPKTRAVVRTAPDTPPEKASGAPEAADPPGASARPRGQSWTSTTQPVQPKPKP
jgi:peptidoglycan lytic transglycosylase G